MPLGNENVMIIRGKKAKTISCVKAETKEPVKGITKNCKKITISKASLHTVCYAGCTDLKLTKGGTKKVQMMISQPEQPGQVEKIRQINEINCRVQDANLTKQPKEITLEKLFAKKNEKRGGVLW